MLKNIHLWLPGYIARSKPRDPISDVFFCFVDHFEPFWNKASRHQGLERVEHWFENYPRMAEKFRKRFRSEEHTLNSSHQIISYAVFCLKKKNRNGAAGQPYPDADPRKLRTQEPGASPVRDALTSRQLPAPAAPRPRQAIPLPHLPRHHLP